MRWRPYQLNPRAAQAGTNKLEYYKQKFGEQRTASMVPAMKVRSSPGALKLSHASWQLPASRFAHVLFVLMCCSGDVRQGGPELHHGRPDRQAPSLCLRKVSKCSALKGHASTGSVVRKRACA